MLYDFNIIKEFYAHFSENLSEVRGKLQRPLTLTEKILYTHIYNKESLRLFCRGEDYAMFRPDRVAMQDATAQMALLQFMNAGRNTSAVPATVHCDHLISAHRGVETDLPEALSAGAEVYSFLRSAAARFGLGFWSPGAGIIHQVVLENYAFPGGMMVGTDSHTPNAGGLGMLAIGVGGADAVDVMAGMEWELRVPRIIGVRLSGKLSGWTAPKDIILHLAGLLTVKGATNAVIEYFGEGTESLSCTGKATICNMGAEVGATTSVFPFDSRMEAYLRATGRGAVADMAATANLKADSETAANPEKYYDRVIDIDLSTLTPYVNGPFTPDAACPVGGMAAKVERCGLPDRVEVALIGSCTNSSYEDISRVCSVLRQARSQGIQPQAQLVVIPGSATIAETLERDGQMKLLRSMGAVVMTNACGPCIGQWQRDETDTQRRNTIVTSFNRNFAKRADGNPNTHAFVASPEMVAAYFLSGSLSFNPQTDTLSTADGRRVKLAEPQGTELPERGFEGRGTGYVAPMPNAPEPIIAPDSERLQRLEPFRALNETDFIDMNLLIKVSGKCTTDHISMAGPWLKYRGHLENISQNLLMGATNAFTGKTNQALDEASGDYCAVAEVALRYKQRGESTVVVADENYGEGSSREHAAMEPRFLGVKVVLAKSFARIHETNLKKQGVLVLTFANAADYERIGERDLISVPEVGSIEPGRPLSVVLRHSDGSSEEILANHTYNEQQIDWLIAGSALNNLNRKHDEKDNTLH